MTASPLAPPHISPRVLVVDGDADNRELYREWLTLAGWHGVTGSLRYRHIGNYRLDGEKASLRASGLDVLDLSLTRQVRRWMDFDANSRASQRCGITLRCERCGADYHFTEQLQFIGRDERRSPV